MPIDMGLYQRMTLTEARSNVKKATAAGESGFLLIQKYLSKGYNIVKVAMPKGWQDLSDKKIKDLLATKGSSVAVPYELYQIIPKTPIGKKAKVVWKSKR